MATYSKKYELPNIHGNVKKIEIPISFEICEHLFLKILFILERNMNKLETKIIFEIHKQYFETSSFYKNKNIFDFFKKGDQL